MKIASDPMFAQSPNSGCPDPNSGVPPQESDEAKRFPQSPPPPPRPGMALVAPLTGDLLNKQAKHVWATPGLLARFRAQARYNLLTKVSMNLTEPMRRIGEVKHQPSAMHVSAAGEGDMSRLKVKPWNIEGEAAWDLRRDNDKDV